MRSSISSVLSLSVLSVAIVGCSNKESPAPEMANYQNNLQAGEETPQGDLADEGGGVSQDVTDLKGRLDGALAEIAQLKKERDEAIANGLLGSQQIQELKAKLDEAEKAAQAALAALQIKLNDAEALVASLTQQLNVAIAKGEADASQIRELQVKLDDAQKIAQATLEELQGRLNDANAMVADLTRQLKEAIDRATISDQKVQQAADLQAKLEAAEKAAHEAQAALQIQLNDANAKIADLTKQLNDAIASGAQNVQQIQVDLDVAQQQILKVMDALKTKDSMLFKESLVKAQKEVEVSKTLLDDSVKSVTAKGEEIRTLSETLRMAKDMTIRIEGCNDGGCQKVGLRELAKVGEQKALDAHIAYSNSVMEVTLRSKVEADLIAKYGDFHQDQKATISLKEAKLLETAAKDTLNAKAARDAAYKTWMELDKASREGSQALELAIAERKNFLEAKNLDQIRTTLTSMEDQRNVLLVAQHDAEDAYRKAVANANNIQAVIDMIDQSLVRKVVWQQNN